MRYQDANTLSPLNAALLYALHGHPVLPLQPNGKAPLNHGGKDNATTDPAIIRGWWTFWPEANIGLAMRDRYHTLDIDNKKGQRGTESYLAAGGEPMGFCPQPVQRTPNAGYHILFRADDELANFSHKGEFGGLDVRASGKGYILAAPSVIDGKAYQWGEGDPRAPLPEKLLENLRAWSSARPTLGMGPLAMPTPTEMSDEEVAARIAALDGADPRRVHTGFLLEGEAEDRSTQAYNTSYHAFQSGWSLADMARIGRDTVLATFGEEEPHNAPDPWKWCWRYPISSAWHAVQAQTGFEAVVSQEMFGGQEKTPTGRAGVLKEDTSENGQEQSSAESEEVSTHSFETLKIKAEGIGRGDIRAVQRLLLDAVQAQLGLGELPALLLTVKEFSGLGVGDLRSMAAELTKSFQAKKAEAKGGQPVAQEVYVRDQGKLYDTVSGKLITETAFRSAKAREFDGDMEGAYKAYVTSDKAACQLVESLTYHPGLPPGYAVDGRGVALYNVCQPSNLAPAAGDIAPWLNLLRALRLEGGEQDEQDLLDHLAYVVQRPETKVNHGVLIGGAMGIGKDSLLEPFLRCLGRDNVNHISGSEIEGSFSSWQAGARAIVLNELDFGEHRERRRIAEILKPVLSAPPMTLSVDEKYVRPYDIPNLVSVFAFTNARSALYTSPGERRWLALWAGNRIPEDRDHPIRLGWEEWFTGYWGWLDKGGSAAVYAHLLSRDVSAFNPAAKPRTTAWLAEMTDASVDLVYTWLLEAVRERYGCFSLPVVDFDAIIHDARQICAFRFGIPADRLKVRRISAAISAVGIAKTRDRQGRYLYFPGGRIARVDDGARIKLMEYKNRVGVPSMPGVAKR